MENDKALQILKLFYFGCEDMTTLCRKANVSKEEAREILKGARECGLINFSTKDYGEVFCNVKKLKLQTYLRSKGAIK